MHKSFPRLKFLLVHAALALLMFSHGLGCGSKPSSRFGEKTVERPGESPVQHVEDDDPQMNAAIAQARATTKEFIAALENRPPTAQSFAIKREFVSGDDSEHIWLMPVEFVNGRFVATVNNKPLNVTGVEMGQQVEVPPEEISDWMYVDQGKLVGGYTIRVIRGGFDEAGQQEFDRQVPFIIE